MYLVFAHMKSLIYLWLNVMELMVSVWLFCILPNQTSWGTKTVRQVHYWIVLNLSAIYTKMTSFTVIWKRKILFSIVLYNGDYFPVVNDFRKTKKVDEARKKNLSKRENYFSFRYHKHIAPEVVGSKQPASKYSMIFMHLGK